MLTYSCPVGGGIAELITNIWVYVIAEQEPLDQLMVAFTCCNVEASEPLLILDFGLRSVLNQELHDVFHVT